jgi:phenylacetic acid degradation protein
VLHSCVVQRDALIGMKAVVMDEAEIGEQAFVAACSFVPAGMKVPARHLVAGVPARLKRELAGDELEWKQRGTLIYQELTRRCLGSLTEVEPLTALDADRPKLQYSDVRSLIETRRELRSDGGR